MVRLLLPPLVPGALLARAGQRCGEGLGLSISYGIIQKHGGAMHVASADGLGTEFTIELPVRWRGVEVK